MAAPGRTREGGWVGGGCAGQRKKEGRKEEAERFMHYALPSFRRVR